MAESPPIIRRPIPRRPFDLNSSFEQPPSPSSPSHSYLEAFSSPNTNIEPESPTYLRAPSSTNLTSSTLYGIYGTEPQNQTPLQSRHQSPISSLRNTLQAGGIGIAPPSPDNPRVTSIILHRTRSKQQTPQFKNPNSKTSRLANIRKSTWRVSLLFTIGVFYGLLVFHLQNEGGARKGSSIFLDRDMDVDFEGIMRKEEGYNWKFLVFWGVAGVGLGSLVPWVDGLWEERCSGGEMGSLNREKGKVNNGGGKKNRERLAADWNPVVRSVGIFVGIAFAIRKIPWTSTLQVSLTLALINPVLWYLVDRSLPSLLLSLLIATFGTFLLLALNPSMMPPPLSLSTSSSYAFSQSSYASSLTQPLNPSQASKPSSDIIDSLGNLNFTMGTWNWTAVTREGLLKAGVLDYAQLLEIAIWVGSVLFCSVVCFGGIGRRLGLRRAV